MPGERTEKPTGKRRDEARKKGQVARSNDVNGAVVTVAALLALSTTGPKLVGKLEAAMYQGLTLISTPDVVSRQGIGTVLRTSFGAVAGGVAPIAFTCMAGGLLANVAQNRPRLNTSALKPD